jgi:GT2 family glycosyltransferase
VDAYGLDLSEYAIEHAHEDVRPYLRVGYLTEPLPRRYDLIVCIEVLEHLSPVEADKAIENFCKHADDVLISTTPFEYKDVTHLNVRPPDYWAQRFAHHGFFRDMEFDASFITPWAVRFRKTCDPAWRVVYGYERQLWQLEKEVQARRQLTVEQQDLLGKKEEESRALSAEIAQHLETIESLKALLSTEHENARHLLVKEAEHIAAEAEHQQTVAQLSSRLNEREAAERESADRLAGQLAEQHERLTEQGEKLAAAAALVASGQASLEASAAQLLDRHNALESLTSQLAEKEKTVAALTLQATSQGQALERLHAELRDKQQAQQQLESRLAEAASNVESLSATNEDKERALSALAAQLAEREHAVRTLTSRGKAVQLSIDALERQRAEVEQTLAAHQSEIEKLAALLAVRDAQLADVNNSMVWYLYNRIKYPYLMAFFRLYEKIKYRYLMSVYRRLGLASGRPAAAAAAQLAATEVAETTHARGDFPVADVAPAPALAPHSASVEIIVCIHNAPADVRRCLESVIANTRAPYSLILVDDGSGEETRDYVAAFADSQGAALIRNEKAKGYTFAANQGLRRSRAEYVVLLNSDTVVTPLWLDRMVACAESDEQVGLVGPLSNAASWQSVPELFRDDEWADNTLPEGFKVGDMAKLLAQFSARIHPPVPFLNGFCLMIKRGVIEQLGYFDEEAFGRGYGEENDYCLRARKAGRQLRVADDAYVYHAQSRSYSHERRKELSRHADAALHAKHDPEMILKGVEACRSDRLLEGIRARSRAMLERRRLVESGKERWEGKRVLFILALTSGCGGGNVVIDEAEAMRKMGVDARLLNLNCNRVAFERSYPDIAVPVVYVEDRQGVLDTAAGYDAVTATAYDTVFWLDPTDGSGAKGPVKAYYVQDFEPYFFTPDSRNFMVAWDSYTEHRELVRFTKTEWNRDMVLENAGVDCVVVGPSVNIDLNRPRRRRDPDWPVRPLRVAAMIRPSTPRRNPRLTMEVLREAHRLHGANIEIILFGCDSSDPEFLALPHDFAWRNAGMLTRPKVANLLNEVDLFVDFSEFQAMGLTAMEAMACGAAVILPRKGGGGSFAANDRNAVAVDTGSKESCVEALDKLILDEKRRARLQQQALTDICAHSPERAAYNILDALFPSR